MKNRKLLVLVVLSVLGASTALACGWSFWTDHSVRFSSERTGRGFYRLPPLPIKYDPAKKKEITASESVDDNYWSEEVYEHEKPTEDHVNVLWESARKAAEQNNLKDLGSKLTSFLEETKYLDNGQQQNRNDAVDILDVLKELPNGASTEKVIAYVNVRLGITHDEPLLSANEETRQNSISRLTPRDRRALEDNWAYLRAANLFNSDQQDAALEAFQDHAKRFPKSEKNEAVLYMLGRLTLEKSHAAQTETCGIEGTSRWGEPIEPSKIEPAEKCKDEYWKGAMNQFQEAARRFPQGRYRNDVRGWIAFLHKRGGERAEALAEYYRLLGQTDDPRWRLEAKKSLQMIGHQYDDETLDKVETLIADEPDAALAYAYHRIYNHATDFTYEKLDEWCCSGDNAWSRRSEETARVKKAVDLGRYELERVAKFAAAMLKRYGSNRVSGDFLVRLAQTQLELENFREARSFAARALASGTRGESRAQALWVRGSVEHQQKQFTQARSTLSKLLAEFPNHRLTEGTRRLLAITAEDQNDLEFALDQYLALDYNYDIAYFVDILMPTERLAKYVLSRKETDHADYLNYGLAVRLMRDRKWNDAREMLLKVRTQTGTPEREGFEKEPEHWRYHNDAVVKTEWVSRDLQTIEDLDRLERSVDASNGDEAKAEAMYQLASYQFDADPLLFYNPAAWRGMRHMLLFSFADGDNMRLPGENFKIIEASRIHETYARAIPIYLDIVDRFPETAAAKDALYSAVISHEKLGDLNPYWRDIYGDGFFAGPRWVGNADIRRMFPKFRWPRSRVDWQASSRSVKGGPTYEALPKPHPKLTREQRLVNRLSRFTSEYGPSFWKKAVAAKNGVRDAALFVSSTIAAYLQNYYYLVYTGFIAAIFWANRKEIYDGPVTKGSVLMHRGLLFLGRHLRDWWTAIAVPSIFRSKPDGVSDPTSKPGISTDNG